MAASGSNKNSAEDVVGTGGDIFLDIKLVGQIENVEWGEDMTLRQIVFVLE
jgi:hypothetical protein